MSNDNQKEISLADRALDSSMQLQEEKRVGKMNTQELGLSGTIVNSGRYDEEYLTELTGPERADVFDKMRRSDGQVKMLLSARKNPILSANWFIQAASQDAEHIKHKDFIENELFNRSRKPFKAMLEECLSFVDFGFAAFEKVHEVVKGDPTFGDFIGLKKLAWRSQRTIQEFNLDPEDGTLLDVRQVSSSDLNNDVNIDGKNMVIMTLDKIGDNHEGIAALRPIYGNYLRKQNYHKIIAIGAERYAIATPVGTIPKGKEGTNEATVFKNILAGFTSHQRSYITKAEGWEIELTSGNFDPEKLVAVIQQENLEMAKAFVAMHLELGTGGNGGAYALGTDMSDQFLSIIQADADIISRAYNEAIIKELIDFNFGVQSEYPKLKVTGINDKLGKEFAEIVKILVEAKALTPNKSLEIFLRKEFKAPELSEQELAEMPNFNAMVDEPTQTAAVLSEKITLAETSRAVQKQNKKIIDDGAVKILKVMGENLPGMMETYRNSVEKQLRSTNVSGWDKIALETEMRGAGKYKTALNDVLIEIAADATRQAKREAPSSIKLAEEEDLNELDKAIKTKLAVEAAQLAGTQMADIEKVSMFTFTGALDDSEDIDRIMDAIRTSHADYLEKATNRTAAVNSSSKTVNRAKWEFFTSPEIINMIVAYEFLNPDPKTAICKDLNGRIFRKNDPQSREFRPPLHHNCKSFIAAIYEDVAVDKITDLIPSTREIAKQKTL